MESIYDPRAVAEMIAHADSTIYPLDSSVSGIYLAIREGGRHSTIKVDTHRVVIPLGDVSEDDGRRLAPHLEVIDRVLAGCGFS